VAKYKFGQRSEGELKTCSEALQRVTRRALAYGVLDFAILEGHRGQAKQDRYYAEGKSRLKFPNGNHNAYPSNALDAIPCGSDGKVLPQDHKGLREALHFLAGLMFAAAAEEGVVLRWGGAWDGPAKVAEPQKFDDLFHFEVRS